MFNTSPHWLSPAITLAATEHRQLSILALAGTDHGADIADDLLHELDRARIVADCAVAGDVIRMGSRVKYSTGRDERTVTLVFPVEADIAKARISILTPVGTALIGLRTGQSITFRTRDGRPQLLTVLAVYPPEEDEGPRAA
jgi:regulator of nucleoside diphosphate kinase